MTRFFTTFLLTLALCCVQLGLASPALALYELDFGDSVNVTVKDFPQYSFSSGIRPDGVITVPFQGDVEALGLTPEQLAEKVKAVLRRTIRNPEVFVTVTTFRARTVTVLGQVTAPGKIDLTRSYPTLLDVIAGAGGFTHRAARHQVTVVRGDGPDAQRFVIDVEKILEQGDVTNNIEIQTGDRIHVPEVWYPDFREIMVAIAPVITVISTLVFLINIYDQASRRSQGL